MVNTKTVLVFDLDGTLIDRSNSLLAFSQKIYNYYQVHYHIKLDKSEFISLLIKKDAKGSVSKKTVYNSLAEKAGISNFDFPAFFEFYQENFYKSNVLFSATKEALDFFKTKNYKLDLITNGSQTQMDKIKLLGLEKYFEHILISETFGAEKPDLSIFKAMKNYYQPESQFNFVYIGDDMRKDIAASKKAGYKAIWISDGRLWDSSLETSPDLSIDSILEYRLIENKFEEILK